MFDRRLLPGEFFARYPLLSDVGMLQALIDSGAVESWMSPTLRTDKYKYMSFNEEAVAAAQAAEVLRRQDQASIDGAAYARLQVQLEAGNVGYEWAPMLPLQSLK